ncbi:uncharacterized protein PHALS_08506 [Plasmopara halstedii]|uniref:Uncharacterized protein n=1 Tax=Plasmopara halstedii TaxID=4781 RepID=A0A0P1ACI0_PLAHL|nr:uncharacterized protein PHALS_08506 [Plasmopara halstedii]CEG38428.1 hypothetical protein PHALS_08506 [Plasmopara halstedii]|eukprot:XP_024574797.1 hypothetical protein PHALS_08506 [Plasmopara halstedii]
MEKDLRDAYAALKLLRADLVKTRRDKRALEQKLRDAADAIRGHKSTVMASASEDGDNQQESEEVEKLALLDKLHSLTATVEQQMETMLVQKAAFALEKGELESALEATQLQLQEEKNKEKEEMIQEIETLRTKLAAYAQTNSILKQQVDEKEEEQKLWESKREEQELRLHLEHTQKMDSLTRELSFNLQKNEKECGEKQQHEMMELQQRCGLLELALYSEKEEKVQIEVENQKRNTLLSELDSKCEELKAHVAALETKQSETEFTQAQTKVTFDTKVRQLESELLQSQEKLAESENKVAQLAAAKAKYVTVTKDYENRLAEASQELLNHEQKHQQNVVALCNVNAELEKAQAALAGSEATILSNAEDFKQRLAHLEQYGAQKEKTIQILTIRNENLQHEINDARQTTKLTTEKLLQCQSIAEQRFQQHIVSLQQCESLESQLLSAEDHQGAAYASIQGSDSFVLKVFHGLSDNDIAALPPTKFWGLLRSGINEIENFFPQLQTLFATIDEVFRLCKTHADSLSVLCCRLEEKSENEDNSILVALLRLLRFIVMLKVQSQQDSAIATVDIVQKLRKRVLNALAQWFEIDASDNHHSENTPMPTPTFTITSRETALILQNWTSDRSKQLGVRRWLARMEAYPGVPPLRGAKSNHVLELPSEGCTLELEEMTSEVKDAFLLLLIPILKQNQALHVRTFIRYIDDLETESKRRTSSAIDTDDDLKKNWSMRIHVESVITHRVSRPTSLKLSPHGLSSSLNSPASSVSSSTSSSASSRLQIIQERLQYLHDNT